MNTEKIKQLIESSDMTRMEKNITTGFITRSEQHADKNQEDIILIGLVANEKKLSEILYSSDEVKIYSIYGTEDWDIKFPIRSIFKNKKGTWERCCTVSPSLDIAFLVFLENKYLGSNSHFTDFALKMLEIKVENL